MEGQVFVTSAIAFSALIVIAALPTGPSISAPDGVRSYFSSSIEGAGETFRSSLNDTDEPREIEKDVYGYYWFIERATRDRNLEFGAQAAMIFPSENQVRVVNYRSSSSDFTVRSSTTWHNFTLSGLESQRIAVARGAESFYIGSDFLDREVDAANPRMVHWMRISSDSQNWQNTRTG